MKICSRTLVSLLVLTLLLFSAAAFAAETPAAQKPGADKPAAEKPAAETAEVKLPDPVNFGKDANKMQWYLVNYGKEKEKPFAVARKYYTNPEEKKKTEDLLVTKFSIEQEKASTLYFTEYRYVYSADAKQFALTYINHYDMVGDIIKGTEYEESFRPRRRLRLKRRSKALTEEILPLQCTLEAGHESDFEGALYIRHRPDFIAFRGKMQ